MRNSSVPQQNTSEIARLLARIQTEHEAAERGLSGLAAGWSRHEFVRKRAHGELSDMVGEQEATRLIAVTIWGQDEIAAASSPPRSREEHQSQQ